jgi:membrane-associated phospholipid phosphatase
VLGGIERRGTRGGLRAAPPPLLSPRLRPALAVLVAACAVLTLALGLLFAGQAHPGGTDVAVDRWFRIGLDAHQAVLSLLADLGDGGPVALITAALIVACGATRRWWGCVLTAVAEPAAAGLTEFVLKPATGRTMNGMLSYPSGHATAMFALATICAILLLGSSGRPSGPSGPSGPGGPGSTSRRRAVPLAVRAALALAAYVLAAAVAVAMIAIGAHYFTDAVGGTAVGTGVALAVAFVIDGARHIAAVHRSQAAGGLGC